MYKLVIVDDEEEIRQGLSEFIDWNEMGFEISACFEDGKEAIEFLEKNDIDIVLTDIMMAQVSGLKLAEYVYKNKPHVSVVIISGHKEFEYAKKAIEFNVENYLLKPTDIDEIVKVFTEIRGKLDRENEKKLGQIKMQKHYQELLPMLEEQFFTDLLMGGFNDETQIKKKSLSIGIEVDPLLNPCIIAEICLDLNDNKFGEKWLHGKERMYTAIKNFFRFSKEGIKYIPVFVDNDLKIFAIASTEWSKYYDQQKNDYKNLKNKVNAHLNEAKAGIKKLLGLNLSINVDKVFDNVLELARFREPIKVKQGSIKEPQSNIGNLEQEVYLRLTQKQKLFMSVINEGDKEELVNLVDAYLDEISALPIRFTQRLVGDLFAVLFNKLAEIGITFKSNTLEKTDYISLRQLNDIEELKELVKDVLLSLMEQSLRHKNNATEASVNKAIQYIEKNFNKDISLEDVSNEVFLNAVYFSRLFKQQTGENFTDYLTKVRMETAIKLIRTGGYKTFEISNLVGYGSSKYFARVFKYYTGYTPKDYLRNMR